MEIGGEQQRSSCEKAGGTREFEDRYRGKREYRRDRNRGAREYKGGKLGTRSEGGRRTGAGTRGFGGEAPGRGLGGQPPPLWRKILGNYKRNRNNLGSLSMS